MYLKLCLLQRIAITVYRDYNIVKQVNVIPIKLPIRAKVGFFCDRWLCPEKIYAERKGIHKRTAERQVKVPQSISERPLAGTYIHGSTHASN